MGRKSSYISLSPKCMRQTVYKLVSIIPELYILIKTGYWKSIEVLKRSYERQ